MLKVIGILFGSLLLIGVVVTPTTSDASPSPWSFEELSQWARDHGEKYLAHAIAPDKSCAVLTTDRGIRTLRRSGKLLWQRPYFNPWMASYVTAAAPGCKRVSVGGSSGYKNVWILGRSGVPNTFVSGVEGTPTALRFNHAGSRLAIGTATGQLLTVDLHGRRRSRTQIGMRIDGLSFSPDDQLLLTSLGMVGAGLSDTRGAVLWQRSISAWMSITPTSDWQRFMIEGWPGHGESSASLELVSRRGRTLWSKVFDSASSSLTPDGRNFLVVASDDVAGTPDNERRWLIDHHGHQSAR